MPLFPDFSKRAERDEHMEDPSLSEETLKETTNAIERLSRLTGGLRASLRGLEQLVDTDRRELSILDVGTGNGAILREFAQWGLNHGVEIEAVGIDLIDSAIDQARRETRRFEGLSFEKRNLFDIDPGRRFDVVHASLVLHHFKGDAATEAIRKMAALSRVGLVVNDLHRHPVHWLSSKVIIPLVTDNEISHHDGPVSVLRGFTRRELVDLARDAGLASYTIEWTFPFRWLLVGRG